MAAANAQPTTSPATAPAKRALVASGAIFKRSRSERGTPFTMMESLSGAHQPYTWRLGFYKRPTSKPVR